MAYGNRQGRSMHRLATFTNCHRGLHGGCVKGLEPCSHKHCRGLAAPKKEPCSEQSELRHHLQRPGSDSWLLASRALARAQPGTVTVAVTAGCSQAERLRLHS
eukprot:1159245-Pelagomonas_calceolata.AAC.13